MSRPGDELLAVISARQRLPWRTFRNAFDVLHSRALASGSAVDEPVGTIRMRSLRLFSELAHAELPPFEMSTTIAAAPTVLACLPRTGLPRALLCGSRDIITAAAIREACSSFGQDATVLTLNQPYSGGYAPAMIAVETTDWEVVQRVAERSRVQFVECPPAWTILRASATLDEYESSLAWTTDPDPLWLRKDFNDLSLSFNLEQDEHSLHLSSFMDPVAHRQIHRIWHDGVVATVDRDWGRWLFLNMRSLFIVDFDSEAQIVCIPSTVPLPRLLARSLTLFSGFAPHRRMHPDNPRLQIDVYRGIPREAAELLALKLGQKLIHFQMGR